MERRGYVGQSRPHSYNKQQEQQTGEEKERKDEKKDLQDLHERLPTSIISDTNSTTTPHNMSGTSGTSDDGRITPATMPTFYAPGMMPRPGQPLYFDGTDVSEFLRRWNIECEDFGINEPKKCARLPYYCSKEVKDVVEILDGYVEEDWTKLEAGLKEHYWQNDTQKNSVVALKQLIADASTLDLSVYVLKFSSITTALITNGEISPTQRCCQFLEGLTPRLRDKAFDFCAEKDWRLSSRDTGTKSPDFDELKKYILGKAKSEKKRIVYNKERAVEPYEDLKESAAAMVKAPPPSPAPATSPTLTSPVPTPNSDPAIIELTKQLASLTLMMQAQMSPQSTTVQPKPTTAKVTDRVLHCIARCILAKRIAPSSVMHSRKDLSLSTSKGV